MHPILKTRQRLGWYLMAWSPVAALLGAVAWSSGAGGLLPVAAEVVPGCVLMAFLCLSPWYICRARPLRISAAAGLAATFLTTAAVAALILVACVQFMALLLERPSPPLGALFAIGLLLYLVSVGLHYAILAAESSREAAGREAEARTLLHEAELQSLRLQLNPHFLFNSLHSISALATVDGARAREMCILLADFLRASLGVRERETLALGEELALARSYLDVERVRFGARLRVEEEIADDCLDCEVPALLLQPLIENAVKHGISGLLEGGTIRLTARRQPEAVAIRIENRFDPEAAPRRSLGMGQAHVRRRLEVRYRGAAAFETRSAGGIYFADLRLPCESPMASSSRA